ncbi:MAG: hypothetical protein B6244_04835 [Candidatus Cloacimonetes bacterium 4572_55]|nr:MAG: hypothetical protein B6244_04835 [Candidatus Cloacimonetes bacterium 4572_55]
MFTGLIEEKGVIRSIRRQGDAVDLIVEAETIFSDLKIGDSIAVNGVCLTATEVKKPRFTAKAVEETVTRTALRDLRSGSKVNLERALRLTDRLGGHLVSGHVDTVSKLLSTQIRPESRLLVFQLDRKWTRYLIEKGSVAVNGVSLTISALTSETFTVSIIPETWRSTALNALQTGKYANIEVDMIGKYIERLLQFNKNQFSQIKTSGISVETLQSLGY